MKSKYKVSRQSRTSELSDIETSMLIEIHFNNGTVKIYDNIHYPINFCKRAFNDDSSIDYAIVIDKADNSNKKIRRKDIGI